jgi:hypothetical protein
LQSPFICNTQKWEEVRLPQHDLARIDHDEYVNLVPQLDQREVNNQQELDHAGSFTHSLGHLQFQCESHSSLSI